MKKKFVKFLSISFVLILVFNFTACTKEVSKENANDKSTTKLETTTTQTTVEQTTTQTTVANVTTTLPTTTQQTTVKKTKTANNYSNNDVGVFNNTVSNSQIISNGSSMQDIANYYNEAMAISKDLQCVKGKDSINVGNIQMTGVPSMFAGLMRTMINNQMPQIFEPSTDLPLPAYGDKNIKLLADDIEYFNILDKGSTYTLTIKPKMEQNPAGRNCGPQSRFFNILEGVQDTVAGIDGFSFSSGTAYDNVSTSYYGGKGIVIIDKATKKVTSATYQMISNVTIKNILISDGQTSVEIPEAIMTFNYNIEYR